MNQDEKKKKSLELAKDILLYSRDNLVLSFRYLNKALYQLSLAPIDSEKQGSNGAYLFYNYKIVLQKYKEERESVARFYLHTIFHYILKHPFDKKENTKLWNLATDIAVENTILNLNLNSVQCSEDKKQVKVLDKIKENTELTAEKIYKYLCNNPPTQKDLDDYQELFFQDNHEYWHFIPKDFEEFELYENIDKDKLNEQWQKISEEIKVSLEAFSEQEQDAAIIQNLREVHRDRYDYTKFLKKFASVSEEISVNHDEFDYSFYMYGMELYENMPLIEPLEYKEAKKIRDFIIAIDTSGSCSGELVQKFLEKTYSILKSTESFFKKVNIHIIQCDYLVRDHVKITELDEFDKYLDSMELIGFGSTDFRPVFLYVDELIERKEFDNLKGLIYFTDGYGNFPNYKPDYEVAFVFLEQDYNNPKVPPWANKLVLREEDI